MGFGEKDLRIVLVRPRNPLNMGAAARAMCNFGYTDLVAVAPHEPVWLESRAAPGAGELLRKARVTATLAEAIEDRTLVLGTSSLSRRTTSQKVLSLVDLPAFCRKRKAPVRIALAFGPEKSGLRNEDLDLCHAIVRIPTIARCPSMNLGQAVAVCCYELSRTGNHPPPQSTAPPATAGEVERLVQETERLLGWERQGRSSRETAQAARLRRMLLGWPLRSQDVTLALGVLRDLSWRLRQTER